MRLTLRTLLAYLDDTLEPSEIKEIGQKIAESDAAQALTARIKQVTRRRLTAPSDAGKGDAFDANTVAAYLDNELSGDQLAEIEKRCLDSDVHLAEIAACHQILTLVLGEPAVVPATAKERMYGLVKGREAIPYRKAPADTVPGEAETEEDDDAMMSVLTFHRQQNSWKRWILPVASLLLFVALPAVLLVALLQASHAPRDTGLAVVVPPADKIPLEKDAVKDKTDKTAPDKDKTDKKNTDNSPPDKDKIDKVTTDKDKTDKDKTDKDGAGQPVSPVERPAEPSKEQREVAVFQGSPQGGAPTILIHQPRDQKIWKRLTSNSPIQSTEQLVSLPGYASEILTSNKNVRLQLWGTLPEFTLHPFLFESAVVLHANPNFDLDLTLERGRIFLFNNSTGPVRIRLRFEKEIWDVTLAEARSEIGVDLFKHYTRNIDWRNGDAPRAEVKFCLLEGKGGLRVNYQEFPNLQMPGPAQFFWDNQGVGLEGPIRLDKPLPVWNRDFPANKPPNEMKVLTELREALGVISQRLSKDKPVKVMFDEILDEGTPAQRYVSLCGLCAIDAIPDVLDVLENKDEARSQDRLAAIMLLRRWLSQGADHGQKMFDKKEKAGFLYEKTGKTIESEIILSLLHDFDEVKRKEPETFDTLADYLTSNRMSIRELAYWHLVRLSIGAKTIPPFNAAWPPEQREAAAKKWKAMVANRELPPPPPPGAPTGAPMPN